MAHAVPRNLFWVIGPRGPDGHVLCEQSAPWYVSAQWQTCHASHNPWPEQEFGQGLKRSLAAAEPISRRSLLIVRRGLPFLAIVVAASVVGCLS